MFYVQSDHLGTPRAVVDSQRDVAIWEWSNRSEVFGNQTPNHDPDGDGAAFKLTLRFPGQQATEASGMFYNYQRDYDPTAGRYSQSDPAGLRGGISTYGYVEGNSVSNYDPMGLSSISRTYKPSPYLPPSSGPVHPDYPELGSSSYGPTFYPGKFAVSSLLLVTTSSQYLQLLNAVYAKALPEPKDARDPNGAKAPGLPCEDDGYTRGKDGPK